VEGKIQASIELFDLIASRAPQGFRRMTPLQDNVFTKNLPRLSGLILSLRDRFLFIKTAQYARDIFAHRGSSNPDIFDDLDIGQEVNFRIRFNREGPMAIDIQLGRLPAGITMSG
jgi:cold shock CspA family protein